MTPCEEKGYKVGQVFEIKGTGNFPSIVRVGDLAVLDDIEGRLLMITGDLAGAYQWNKSGNSITRLYPPEEEKQVETITLMGKEYDKAEIEAALKDVLPVGES